MSFAESKDDYSDPLDLLGAALREAVAGVLIDVAASRLPPSLQRRRGVFVTLMKNGSIRGCMGTFWPLHKNAGRELVWSGLQAAFNDVRFPPLGEDEIDDTEAVIDLLDQPRRVLPDQLDLSLPALAVIEGVSVVMLPPEGVASWNDALSLGGPGSAAESSPARILAEVGGSMPPADVIGALQDALGASEPAALWTAEHERVRGPVPAGSSQGSYAR